MKRVALALVLPLFLCGTAANALQVPRGNARDDRVRTVIYDPYNVTKVVGVIRSSTQVMFADDEEVVHVAVGDAIAWEVAPAGNILFLKPRERHPPTNLQVVTTRRDGSKRSYQFDLSMREGSMGPGTDTYFVVRFAYPDDEAARARAEAAIRRTDAGSRVADTVLDLHQRFGPRNWSYSAQGRGAIEPQAVYDDGKSTTFRFEGNLEIPAIYIVNSDGQESLINKDVRGDLVVVHAIAPKFVLRRGGDVICVYNEAYSPSGINPRTGTTSPSVQRTLRVRRQ
ncbi:MAG TPA: P-type conjugative transfer protein VirB9 [Beijerinckiaceae bacterium]|nr:P-type conjugative transfer protein VirB9 [Beijerinckiaceae bacterium]